MHCLEHKKDNSSERRGLGKQLLLEPQEWNGSSCEGEWGNGGKQCSTKKMGEVRTIMSHLRMASEEKGGIRDKLGITYSECSGDPE